MCRLSFVFSISGNFFLLIFASFVYSQGNVGEDSTVKYSATYFSEWAPVTAQDMMDRIPGSFLPHSIWVQIIQLKSVEQQIQLAVEKAKIIFLLCNLLL